MKPNFSRAQHTFILSDVHIADAEPPHPGNPLWKRYKRPKLFVDRTFSRFLEYIQVEAEGAPIELIMNGDIFDFDSVMALPMNPPFKISMLERLRGLSAQEEKSRFKISIILNDHPIWVKATREFIMKGNQLIFIIGNHDMELHWPSVQMDIVDALNLPDEFKANVRFCEWFYISNGDTLIEHGNQYDAYCLCSNPINPLIKKGKNVFVRLPFGNLAGKYMTNGMGLFNPHVESSFIMSFSEYIVFFYKYLMRVQPFIIWTWFWGAMTTLIYSLTEGFMPALKDPLMIETRVEAIAKRSNASPAIVRSLRELHVHPAIFNPFQIMRELWLDRALMLLGIVFICFYFFLVLNVVFIPVSIWWFIVPMMIVMPIFFFYYGQVKSEIEATLRVMFKMVPYSAQIARVTRVVHGHTHREMHAWIGGVEVLNTGTWSPAFKDVECTKPVGKKCFAWIRPRPTGSGRIADLYEWLDPEVRKVEVENLE